ncbi:MAG TPA: hypothetical protein VMS30_01630 [Phycisphaerales bacterium]|nr:hypothetical protein [Phycisphaerales bacterium]
MSAVFNLIIVGLVLLIAYWWANQGLFSAILHLLCVIAAGAIALAIWEPLVTRLLLHNSFFDNYAWGIGLVLPFAIILLALRLIFDKAIGSNVNVPRWANLTFGLLVGAMSGILTVGIFVLGAGFIHSHREILGFTGYARSGRNAEVSEIDSMWFPVHRLTSDFYSMLSVGALRPDFEGTPMQQYYPDLWKVSAGLQRDSFDKGRGRTELVPKEANVSRVIYCDSCNPKRFAVEMTFEAGARDYGEQFTLSASQVRLIGTARGMSKARTAYPDEFNQYSGHHRFDDISHYISSEPGQQRAKAVIEFDLTPLNGQVPRFIMVKGTRFRLPQQGQQGWENLESGAYRQALGSSAAGPMSIVEIAPNGIDITSAVKQARDIRPIQISINQLPAGIKTIKVEDRNWISGGDGEFPTVSPERPGRGLAIDGILQPPGTQIVQVDVSRSSAASIYKDQLLLTAGTGDHDVMLVDSKGRPYLPVGFMWTQPNGKTRIRVSFEQALSKMSILPQLPTSDTHKLKLLFAVTNGSTLAGLKLGDAVVGTCNVLVDDPEVLKQQRPQGGGGEGVGG